MSGFKTAKIGVYGTKTRALQRRLSFEKTSLTYHEVVVYKYLGDTNLNEGSSINDISDLIFMENRDRRYDSNGITLNADVQMMESSAMSLESIGIIDVFDGQQLIRMHIDSFAQDGFGRYPIVGDVVQIPFFKDRNDKSMFFVINDVDEKNAWENYYVTISMDEIKDSQEYEEIDGIQSNSDALADLQSSLNDAYDATYVQEGLESEPSLYVSRDYVEDGYINPPSTSTYTDDDPRDNYDPRLGDSFLDDPNAGYV